MCSIYLYYIVVTRNMFRGRGMLCGAYLWYNTIEYFRLVLPNFSFILLSHNFVTLQFYDYSNLMAEYKLVVLGV